MGRGGIRRQKNRQGKSKKTSVETDERCVNDGLKNKIIIILIIKRNWKTISRARGFLIQEMN